MKKMTDISKLKSNKLREILKQQSDLIEELQSANNVMFKTLNSYRFALMNELKWMLKDSTVEGLEEIEDECVVEIPSVSNFEIKTITIPRDKSKRDEKDESKAYA